jgi:hypothetical protein
MGENQMCINTRLDGCMSVLADFPDDLEPMGDGDLEALLESAEQEERLVSHRRRRMHTRLDGIAAYADTLPVTSAELLPALLQEEYELSERRLLLHQRITEIRLERGRRAALHRLLLNAEPEAAAFAPR